MPRVPANGIEIEYESFGKESDPAILVVMGFAAPLNLWPVGFYEGLAARGFRVIRFDNRDIGHSTHLTGQTAPTTPAMVAELQAGRRPWVPYTLDDMAADAAAMLDALGIERAHIAGASMGGMIAQLVAINHPGKTKSLISIMSTTGRRDLPPAKPDAIAALITPPPSFGRDDLVEASIRVAKVIGSPGYPFAEAELRTRMEQMIDRAPYDGNGIARQWAAIVTAQPRNEKLRGLRVPALVLHGADDPLILPAAAIDTAESIPGAELVIVPGMGHNCNDALVPVYLRHIGGFVDRVEGRAQAHA